MLRIRLLGELEIRSGDTAITSLESGRAESLLAYLLLHRNAPQPRQRLAFLLWPDSTEAQARTNLRHVLHNLRRALPEAESFLHVTTRTLQWRADAAFWLDVADFEASVARAKSQSSDDAVIAWRHAASLYRGDLLAACYDEWLTDERERLRRAQIHGLETLVALLDTLGHYADAITYAEALLRHDPLHEGMYRRLMRLHDARGDRARSLRVYHVCAATLERELGVEPTNATRDAYEALLPSGQATATPAERVVRPPASIVRPAERARLTALWRDAESGRAQLVLLSGEPGVGKTWLVDELRSSCAQGGALTASSRSYPAEGALPFAPVVAWLRSEPFAGRIMRLDRARLVELARLLPEVESRVPGFGMSEPSSGPGERERLFDALTRALVAPGSPPLLLIADDVQWCDRETLQFLHYLVRVEPQARLLVAATVRREEVDVHHPLNELVAGLHALERITELDVERLDPEETAVLAERLTGVQLTSDDAALLYRETEGNALFVVETMRAGWQPDRADQRTSPRVLAVIQSRLARLSEPARNLAGVAATIGRAFTSEVLRHASGADEDALVRALDELWQRRIVREQAGDGYDFTHDKIREAAYVSLSPARRRSQHLRVARALEELHGGHVDVVSGQIAAHYDRAGAVGQAVVWYERAADTAQHLYATPDAIRLLERAHELLRRLPDTPERTARELAIVTGIVVLLGWVEGFASPRVAEAQQRAIALSRSMGVDLSPSLLRSTAMFGLSQERFEDAEGAGAELRTRGENTSDDILLVEGEYVLGIASFWKGRLDAARQHFEAAVALCKADDVRVHLQRYGHDPRIICLSRLGNTLWLLGHPAEAVRARDTALELAEEAPHPHSRSTAFIFASVLAIELGDMVRLREYVDALRLPRLDETNKPANVATQALAGFLDVLDGRSAPGISRIRAALADAQHGQHAPGNRSFIERVLVAALMEANDPHAGLAAADDALQRGSGVRLFEPEMRRARAEFLAAVGAPAEEVDAELARALAVAREQNARGLELRIAATRQRLSQSAER